MVQKILEFIKANPYLTNRMVEKVCNCDGALRNAHIYNRIPEKHLPAIVIELKKFGFTLSKKEEKSVFNYVQNGINKTMPKKTQKINKNNTPINKGFHK